MIAAFYIGDLILLPVLAVLIIFGLWSKHSWARHLVILALLATVFVCQFSLEPLVRAVSETRSEQGLWSEDFRDGVFAMSDAVRDYRPYVLLSAAGLAVLAFRRMRTR
jgi:hypothetical protein